MCPTIYAEMLNMPPDQTSGFKFPDSSGEWTNRLRPISPQPLKPPKPPETPSTDSRSAERLHPERLRPTWTRARPKPLSTRLRTSSPQPQRILDWDLESRAIGFADPEWVPQEVTAIAWSWIGDEHVSYATLLDGADYMFGSFLDAYKQADIITGHNILCMTPETRVLTNDLRWAPAGDLHVGDGLLAFNEHVRPGGRRRMEFATVLANTPRYEDVFAVELDTGETLYATAEHPWLVSTQSGAGNKHRWRRTDELLGSAPKRKGDFPKKSTLLYRVFEPWNVETSWDAGWLAGAYDGEGSIARHGSNGNVQSQIVFNQNAGVVLDTAQQLLKERGFELAVSDARACRRLRINGGKDEKLRFLGQIRPARLLEKWQTLDPGRLQQLRAVRVLQVTTVGRREIAALGTTSGTYIAEGFGVHNSFDLRVLQADLLRCGFPKLTSIKVQDTIRIVKTKGFKKGQDNLSVLLRNPIEKQELNWQEWREAYEESDWRTVVERVVSDVRQHKIMRERMIAKGWLRPSVMWAPE